jgi:hypothetical protein
VRALPVWRCRRAVWQTLVATKIIAFFWEYNHHAPEYNRHAPEYNRHAPEYNRHAPEYNRHAPVTFLPEGVDLGIF